MRLRLFHWKPEEARPIIAVLEAAGHTVEYHDKLASYREVRESPPDAVVIDLSRLHSHGRELAVFLRGSPRTRHVPVVFLDGEAEKLARIRQLLPDAIYTSQARLVAALRKAKPIENPARPTDAERWPGRTTAQKMGVTENMRVAVVDPPAHYQSAIGDLPQGVHFDEDPREPCKVTLWFAHGPSQFQAALPLMRKTAAKSRLWILWRKQKKDGLDGNLVRAGGIEVGLVDYKICSVNETWSGMVFAIKKAK